MSEVKCRTNVEDVSSSKQWRQGPNTNAKRWTDQDNNPCVAEANASYKCLHETNFDRKLCETYFINYQNCQKYWLKITRERRRLGIRPPLPQAEERARILEENKHT